MSDSRKKKGTFTLIGWVIFGILLFFLVEKVDFVEILTAIQSVPLWVLLFLLTLQVITQLLLATQWYLIARNFAKNCRFSQIFYILSTGSVIESLTPGAKIGGEVTRLYYLKSELGCTTEQSTHIIIIQKCFSMSVMFGICLFSLLTIVKRVVFLPFRQLPIFVFGSFSLLVFLSFLFFSGTVVKALEKKKKDTKLYSVVKSYHENIHTLSKSQWAVQFSISIAVWLLFPFKMMLLLNNFIGIDPGLVIAITMTAYMLALLPLTPGGLGTFEGSMVALFSFFPLETELSLSIAIIFRFITFWFVMLGSTLFVLIYRKEKNHGKNQRKTS